MQKFRQFDSFRPRCLSLHRQVDYIILILSNLSCNDKMKEQQLVHRILWNYEIAQSMYHTGYSDDIVDRYLPNPYYKNLFASILWITTCFRYYLHQNWQFKEDGHQINSCNLQCYTEMKFVENDWLLSLPSHWWFKVSRVLVWLRPEHGVPRCPSPLQPSPLLGWWDPHSAHAFFS